MTPFTNNPILYQQCCAKSEALPLFFQPWWLDAAGGKGNWLPLTDGEFVSPVFFRKKFGLRKITMPPLTPLLGLAPASGIFPEKAAVNLKETAKWTMGLVLHLPETNPAALLQAGFSVETLTGYEFAAGDQLDEIWKRANELSRRDIRKARRQLKIVSLKDVAILHTFMSRSLRRHQQDNSINKVVLERIFEALNARNAGEIIGAEDQQGQLHAVALIAWDEQTTWYLAGGLDERLPQVGASRFLLWHSLEKSLAAGRSFYLGGGLIPGIDSLYKSMGSQEKLYIRARLPILANAF